MHNQTNIFMYSIIYTDISLY